MSFKLHRKQYDFKMLHGAKLAVIKRYCYADLLQALIIEETIVKFRSKIVTIFKLMWFGRLHDR